jgi:BlaI family transcriptional regulator, penicillinase repressor
MAKAENPKLSRRERQMMDILYRRGRASASEIQAELPDAPGYSAVRATLRILEGKGHVRHEGEGLKYVYIPTVPREKATRSALSHLVDTFFGGSAEKAMLALLDSSAASLSPEELDRIAELVERAKKEGK